MREHRQHDRSAAIIKVNYSTHGALKMDYAQNISRGGLFLATNNAFEMHQDIELQLNTPGLKRPVAVPGKVRWIGERGTPPVRGIGVQFMLDDPAVRAHVEGMIEMIDQPQEPAQGPGGEAQTPKKIYLLEPNDFAAEMYGKGITQMSQRDERVSVPFEVALFKTPDELHAALDQARCDVLIIELKSKALDGLSVIEDLNERYHGELPIFAISKPFEGDRDLALHAGASAFLNKPLQMQTLFNTLLFCLGVKAQ